MIVPGRDEVGACWQAYAPLTNMWREPVYDLNVGLEDWRANGARMMGGGFTAESIADALELMCEAAHYDPNTPGSPSCRDDAPPEVRSVNDIPQLRTYLYCIANRIEASGQRSLIQNVPRRVVAMIRGDATDLRPDEGSYGEAVASIRASLRSVGETPQAVAAEVRGFADDLALLELALANLEAQSEIVDLQLASSVLSQTASCVSGATSGIASGAIACSFAAAQIVLQFTVNERVHSMLDNDRQQQLVEFRRRFDERQLRLQSLQTELRRATDQLNGQLAGLESQRRAARRDVAYAMFASSDAGGRTFNVNTVMRRQYNTLLVRYQRAHRAAVQLATLARRAIEQRLGVELSSIHRDMSLVERPDHWVGSVCETTGIDYTRIRDADELPSDNYADMFIGDYVDRLERFVESYRLDFGYTAGGDVSVISLRDDVDARHVPCPTASYNLLAASDGLAIGEVPAEDGSLPEASESIPAWSRYGCATVTGGMTDSCVTVVPGRVTGPRVPGLMEAAAPAAHSVVFAPGGNGSAANTSFRMTAEWQQIVTLPAGLYRLSWYGRPIMGTGDQCLPDAGEFSPVTLAAGAGATLGTPSNTFEVNSSLTGDWGRCFRFYDVRSSGDVRLRITPPTTISETAPVEQIVDVAGLTLEYVGDRVLENAANITSSDLDTAEERRVYEPRPFQATTTFATVISPECEDTEGALFPQRWAYHCDASLCGAGIDACEDDEAGRELCYWELQFGLDPARIEAGQDLAGAGFALGNFNYRIDTIGVNFVGTGSRTCSDPSTPSTCYASGFIPYSLTHNPPYTVIAHDGSRDYEAPLFQGRIEFARGLAAERYISNPISSADGALLAEYTRGELRGRPLAGRFSLRVWDMPGVNFRGIRDVQLVLRYRYFTRTPEP